MANKHRLEEISPASLHEAFDFNLNEEEFSIEKIINKESLIKMNLTQGIIYNYDSVKAGNTEDMIIDLDNIIEARFFDEGNELVIYKDEDRWQGAIFSELKDERLIKEEIIEETYLLRNVSCDKNYPDKLNIKKYIDYDEDNQAYIFYTKPCKLVFSGGGSK